MFDKEGTESVWMGDSMIRKIIHVRVRAEIARMTKGICVYHGIPVQDYVEEALEMLNAKYRKKGGPIVQIETLRSGRARRS